MSLSAVLQATRDALQVKFNLTATGCEVCFDGQPNPACGELFLAVHPLAWDAIEPEDWALGEKFQIGVTATLRMGFAGKDRYGIGVFLANPEGTGLEQIMRKVVTTIHHSQDVRAAMLAYILKLGDATGGGGNIYTPLQFIRFTMPAPKYHDWFEAPAPKTEAQVSACGVAMMAVFGKCERAQDIPDME